MARLDWDAIGERFYETGVDRGVLYISQRGYAWPGLVTVQESPTGGDAKPFYLDGIKYANIPAHEEFEATITAFFSPPEFRRCDGVAQVQNGLFATQQPRKKFDFSYRTRIGNDIDGVDHAYKIHLVYNAMAAPAGRSHTTLGDNADAPTFEWGVTTLPPRVAGIKPTAHFVVDSREIHPKLLPVLEDMLYGTPGTDPHLPTAAELVEFFSNFLAVRPVETSPGVWELFSTDPENSATWVQPNRPPYSSDPTLWIDTTPGDHAIPTLVTGD